MGRLSVFFCPALAFLLAAPGVRAQQPIVIPPAEVNIWQHRLGPEAAVHLSAAELAGKRFIGMEYVEFEIVVSANGRVESAHPVTGKPNMSDVPSHLDEAQAIELARIFKPWLQNGVPVRAQVHDYVQLLPPEQYADKHVPFPDLDSISKFSIGLGRTGCFGTCPAYEVTIDNEGKVQFSGHTNVFIQGVHVAHIKPEAARELLVLFRKADFLSAKDEYQGNWTDNPTQTITLTIGPLSKTVVDYIGTDVGLPLAIRNLEGQIDEAANTRRWIAFTEETVPSLRAEHWNFAAGTPANVALYATTLNNPALTDQFLAAHTPIVSPMTNQASPVCVASGSGNLPLVRRMMEGHPPLPRDVLAQCLQQAAFSGDFSTFQFWLDKGATAKFTPPKVEGNWISDIGLLPSALLGGNSQIAQKLLDLGAPLPKAISDEPIISWTIARSRSKDKQPLIKILAAAGADPNGRDWMGETPLISNNFDPSLIRPLLAAGADLEARDNNGRTPLIAHAFNFDMVRELLAVGADPAATAKNGDTALKTAHQYSCPTCAALIQEALDKRTAAPTVAAH